MLFSGDPRRPYPQDIEMRSGWLGRRMEGIAMETGQPISDSNLQDIMQSSALSVGVDVNSGISKLYCMLQ